ncbi:MAG: DUF302 domain-containing protein [Magnetococcales bacterium]|nr:DUF302 domain-containing protein [Magnetococcales bacterium]NGZ26496.1 DUF302 domain-containing protein [Magnetococcales bacterium]
MTEPLALVKSVSTSYEATIEAATKALAEQGFGILSEIDVSAALKKRLNADYPRTIILGACNPPFALRTLTAVPDISVLLPCNVVVRETENGSVEVAAVNPMTFATMMDNATVNEVAVEVTERLQKALAALV